MKYKLIALMFCMVFLISMVSAVPPTSEVIQSTTGLTIGSNIPVSIPQNATREFELHILNNTNVITSGVTCLLHIYNERGNGGHLYRNLSSTFDIYGDISFVVNNSIHENKGYYSYKAVCNSTGEAGIYERNYFVTKNGDIPAEDGFKIFIYLLFILGTLGLFYTFFLIIAKLATVNETIFGVLIAWCFYILMIIIVFLGENYLINTFVEDLGNTFLTLTVWTNVVLPLISFFITFFIKGTKKKRLLSPQELTGRPSFKY